MVEYAHGNLYVSLGECMYWGVYVCLGECMCVLGSVGMSWGVYVSLGDPAGA